MAFNTVELSNFIEKKVARDEFSGAVLVGYQDEVIFQQAYGQANKRYDVLNTVDTRFNVGSINKMFTAVSITQLAQAGKLTFDDRVGKHLPGYANRDVRENVQIRHLLTHTAGLGSYWTHEFQQGSKRRFRTHWDYLNMVAKLPLKYRPSTSWEYANTGFLILGAIIEAVTGQSYYDYVDEHIYKPANMTRSDSFEVDVPVPDVAIGYTRFADEDQPPHNHWRTNTHLIPIKGMPDGGGYSTIGDLFNFGRAFLGNQLLDKTHTDMLLTYKVEHDPDPRYGYGFQKGTTQGARWIGHTGGFHGIANLFYMFPDLDYVYVLLTNYDSKVGGVECVGPVFDKGADLILADAQA